jgi:hypothetical protein
MPGDNAATVAPDAPVQFPQDGPTSGTIARSGALPGTFNLPAIGTYRVFFQVSVAEAGQLLINLTDTGGSTNVAYSVVGRATGTSQIVGMSIVTTDEINTLLEIRNPVGNATALTLTPIAGGTHPVSASLLIEQIG